jgi:hypothetical protein
VTRQTTETAVTNTLVFGSLGDLAIGNLFPKPAVTPGDFILGIASGTGSLVDSPDPRSGSVSTLFFRTLDAILLGKVLDSGVDGFDIWAATAIMSELTTVLTLNRTTHRFSPSLHSDITMDKGLVKKKRSFFVKIDVFRGKIL